MGTNVEELMTLASVPIILDEITPEERRVSDQFSELESHNCLVFNRLPSDQNLGVVRSTVYVEKTPSSPRKYSPFLARYGLKSTYLLSLLWLIDHPLLALNLKVVSEFSQVKRRNQDHISAEIKDFLARYPSSSPEFDSLVSEELTIGSTHLAVVDGCVYVPLWPTVFVSEEGRFGSWGSAILAKE